MNVTALHRRHPVAVLATAAFAASLTVTVAYFAGLVPGVPKTIPVFADLVAVTGVLFVFAAVTWAMALVG